MSTTRAIIRQRTLETAGLWNGTLATTSTGDSTSVISTALANLPGGADTDGFAEWYVLITESGHTALGESRRASAYDGTSDITLAQALSAASGSGTDFELCRYPFDVVHAAINTALRKSFNHGLWLPVRDETLIVDNILLNPDFEDGTGNTFTNWTQTAGSWTEETSRVWHGSRAVTVTAAGAAAQLTQNRFSAVNIHEMQGRTVQFRGRAFATAASVARLRVSFNGGSTFTNGAYHAGGAEWEGPGTMYVTATIPTTATSLTFYCEVADGGTARFDSLFAYIDSIYQYTRPTSILSVPSHVYYQRDLNDEDGAYEEVPGWYTTWSGETCYLQLPQKPPAGHRLRIEGKGALTALSADTGTAEIAGTQVDLIAELAAAELFDRMGADVASTKTDYFSKRAAMHRARAEELARTPEVRRSAAAQYRRNMVRA